jgi:hypothetical protein
MHSGSTTFGKRLLEGETRELSTSFLCRAPASKVNLRNGEETMFKLTSEKRNPGSKLFALLPLMLMLIGFSSVLLLTSLARAESVLYGGNGGHKNFDGTPLSIHDGWLVTIDQTTGAVIPVGHPAGVARLSGIAFAGRDLLYGATLGGGGFPDVPPPPN